MTKTKTLKFAALCRVSTERQKKRGESLHVQKADIERSVEMLGGKIVAWYGGAEHATAGHEKLEIDRLLSDAKKKRFNATICNHADRWSRDNQKSHDGLEMLRKAGVKFFIQTTEYDLVNPEHLLFLEMSSVFGAFSARQQKVKSLDSRISRAKKGGASCGKLPFGRTYDKETGQWGIDKAKHQMIKDVAKRYLAGGSITDLGIEYGMDGSGLLPTIAERCGTIWIQTFKKHDETITVETEVPRLLPEATIKAIRKRKEANNTFAHRKIKHDYLLSRMIFCCHCGYPMYGQTNTIDGRYKYYRHDTRKTCTRKCDRPKTGANQIPAKVIDTLVLNHLFEMFGNPKKVKEAIDAAQPNKVQTRQQTERRSRIDIELTNLQKGRERLMRLVVRGTLDEGEAEKQLNTIKDKQDMLSGELENLKDALKNTPDSDDVKKMSKKVASQFKRSVRLPTAKRRINSEAWFQTKMTYKEKRSLCEMVFSGKTPDGKRMGVFINWNIKDLSWTFDIRGHLINYRNMPVLSDSQIKKGFMRGAELQDELLTKLTWRSA